MDERIADIKETLKQYEDGEITYVEFAQYVMEKATSEDFEQYSKVQPDSWPLPLPA
jgi:hypothetical protein